MTILATYAGQQRILSYYFRSSLGFRLILLNNSTALNKSSTLMDHVKLELATTDGYSRSGLVAFAAPTDNTTDLASYLPQVSAPFTAGTIPLQYDRAVLIESGHATANKVVSSVTNSTLTIASHGLVAGDRVCFSPGSGGSLPSGLSATTLYYVVSVGTNTFQLATTANGAAIAVGSSWTGNLTCHYANGTILFSELYDVPKTINAGQTGTVTLNFGLRSAA